MSRRFSIAQARDNLAKLVHSVKKHSHVILTRRGEPVAVLVSFEEYQQMKEGKPVFFRALEEFRKRADIANAPDDLAEAFDDVRDSSPGREEGW